MIYLIISIYCIAFALYAPCFRFTKRIAHAKVSDDNCIQLTGIKNISDIKFELFAYNWVNKFTIIGFVSCIFYTVLGFISTNFTFGIGAWIIYTMCFISFILEIIRGVIIDQSSNKKV